MAQVFSPTTAAAAAGGMANAMLDDSFKESHPDLVDYCDEREAEERKLLRSLSSSRDMKENNNSGDDGGGGGGLGEANNGDNDANMMSNINDNNMLQKDSSHSPVPSRKKSVDFSFEGHQPSPSAGGMAEGTGAGASTTPPPGNKRARRSSTDPPWTPKQVVEAISTCISKPERLEAIEKARDAFDHDVQSIHDDEMAAGADAALAKHLTLVLYIQQQELHLQPSPVQDQKSLVTEISHTVDAMESLYRASSEIVGASFRRMGSHVLTMLIKILDEEVRRRCVVRIVPAVVPVAAAAVEAQAQAAAAAPQQPTTNVKEEGEGEVDSHDAETACVDNASASNVRGAEQEADGTPDDKKPGAEGSKEPEMKAAPSPPQQQQEQLKQPPQQRQEEQAQPQKEVVEVQPGTYEGDVLLRKATKIIGHFARVGNNTHDLAHFPGMLGTLVRLVTLKPYECVPWEARLSALWTLANLACNTENMCLMVCTPGLVDALVEVACRPLHPGDDLETIMELLRSRSIASRAILNLSWAPENKVLLSEHAAVIDLLAELGVHRTAPLQSSRTVRQILVTTRRHALAGLRNLAAAPRRTKLALVQYKKGHLLDVLTDAALNDDDSTVKDHAFAAIHNLAVQDTAQTIVQHPALVLALRGVLSSREEDASKTHASGTLMVLERTITPDMEQSYEILRDLLHAVNPAPASDNDDNEDSEMSEVVNATAV